MPPRELGKYWLPVLLWMALIFSASTDLGSMQKTSRIIGPLLRTIWPEVSDKTIHDVQVVVRKTSHVIGYAILALLLWRARQRGFFQNGWNSSAAFFALSISVAYALTDEFHQSFVPTREASIRDVLIDSAGAALALAALRFIGRKRRQW